MSVGVNNVGRYEVSHPGDAPVSGCASADGASRDGLERFDQDDTRDREDGFQRPVGLEFRACQGVQTRIAHLAADESG
jgi:hypothetical protein